MPAFRREFDDKALIKWDRAHEDNAVRALFARWAAPLSTKDGLRVAVRDGYINFYRFGQSVAKLTMNGGVPQLEVHRAYVYGRVADPANRGSGLPQDYVKFDASPATAALVPGWIATAETYAGDEKMFVDRLVAGHSGALDLEMGLPASDLPGSARTAPRMDLVVAEQGVNTETMYLAFWEAKCATNAELRARAAYEEDADGGHVAGPRVIHQLRTYRRWMEEPGRAEQVKAAYRRAADILLTLHIWFIPPYEAMEDGSVTRAQAIWKKVADAEDLTIILPPAIAIASRPMRQSPEAFAEYGRATRSFEGEHRRKLEAEGIVVQELDGKAAFSGPMQYSLQTLSPERWKDD